MKKYLISGILLFAALSFGGQIRAQETKPSSSSTATQNKAQFEEWSEDFNGERLDEKKWEKFTFEGGSGGKLEVKDGEVKIRSAGKTRAGIRTKDSFPATVSPSRADCRKSERHFPNPAQPPRRSASEH